MKPVHIPRSFLIGILALVAVTFLAGTLHAFNAARAATSATPTATASAQPEKDTSVPVAPVVTPVSVSGDTTGIIALAILIVLIVVAGASLGGNKPHKKKAS